METPLWRTMSKINQDEIMKTPLWHATIKQAAEPDRPEEEFQVYYCSFLLQHNPFIMLPMDYG